jgi:anti-sigma factor RsiW
MEPRQEASVSEAHLKLLAYLDGELSQEQAEEVQAWLARDPEARRELELYARAMGALDYLPQLRASAHLASATVTRALGVGLAGLEQRSGRFISGSTGRRMAHGRGFLPAPRGEAGGTLARSGGLGRLPRRAQAGVPQGAGPTGLVSERPTCARNRSQPGHADLSERANVAQHHHAVADNHGHHRGNPENQLVGRRSRWEGPGAQRCWRYLPVELVCLLGAIAPLADRC